MGDKKLRTGWEGTNIPDDFTIPSCGIVDMDRAIFNLFDKDINLNCSLQYLFYLSYSLSSL